MLTVIKSATECDGSREESWGLASVRLRTLDTRAIYQDFGKIICPISAHFPVQERSSDHNTSVSVTPAAKLLVVPR